MSLLNQMLKDLEKRQATAGDPTGLPGTGAGAERTRRFGVLLWVLLALALVLGGLVLWLSVGYWADRDVPVAVEQVELRKVPISATAEMAPAAEPAGAVSEPPASPAAMEPEVATALAETPAREAVPAKETVSSLSESVEPPQLPVAAPPSPKTPAASEPAALVKTPRPLSPEEQARVRFAEGEAALKDGRLPEAEQAWRQALRLDPAQHESREKLAALLAGAGRRVEAEKVYAAGLESDPAHSPFRRGYARLLAEREELSTAREVLRQGPVPTVAADPDFHALYAALSQRLGDYAAAAATYSLLLQHDPASGVSWLGLGLALESDGRAPEAVEAYRQAIASGSLQTDLLSYVRGRLDMLER
ncbi:tetratricopeptide repeat protein [Desulfuromonas sp. KJ2020]|uniref:tetratricopeptide repeat protein n=1 Tax=Desulfuromonas sp. KJ2020 TaxID=2919173 RepID=UPI0020A775DA|nr:tetratricopeptide repeat protein [Desulfuromonas sp. KJ2020]MCP3176607.1 tetratricopeptide repeat protein [Desulfuromonas sp. KJ2020]